jgi:hypothetical protein
MNRLFALFSLVFAVACTQDDALVPEVVVSIDPEFTADVFEDVAPDDGERRPGFWVQSMAPFECAGFLPNDSIWKIGNEIFIAINGTDKPNPCLGDSALLSAFLPLPPLDPGIYDVVFRFGDLPVSSGTLSTSEAGLRFDVAKTGGFDFRNRQALRLPEQILWSNVEVEGEATRVKALEFIDELKSLTQPHGLSPGYYSYFTITGQGTFFFHESFPKRYALDQQVVRKFETPVAELQLLIDAYRNHPDTPLTIRCMTGSGAL